MQTQNEAICLRQTEQFSAPGMLSPSEDQFDPVPLMSSGFFGSSASATHPEP
jgi:hypothetical protein